MSDPLDTNRAVWDRWAATGAAPANVKLPALRAGQEVLQPFERDEVGDVTGKDLLHLQCSLGVDSLAWARRGARVTGVDFSPESIAAAETLAAELSLEASFVESDVLSLPSQLDDRFDVVYTSFGVLAWMSDLRRWGHVVAHFLRPGGFLYLVEYHPAATVFDDTAPGPLILRYPYFPRTDPVPFPVAESGEVIYGWPYNLSGVVNALVTAGLRIDFLHEFNFSDSPHLRFLEPRADGTWGWPADMEGELPLLFSVRATKPAANDRG